MEILVEDELNDMLRVAPEKYPALCRCPLCLAQVKTVALNHLEPFYVTCISGEVYGEYRGRDAESRSQVLVALGRGIDWVSKNPPHPGGARPAGEGDAFAAPGAPLPY